MIEPFLALPECYYPQFAPLPVPMAKHLIREEYRWSRKKAETRRQTPEQIWATIEKRVRDARAIVYEYMNPFVITGQPDPFPSTTWLLDTLAGYTPEGKRNALQTVYYWQGKGLLRRDRPGGHLDPTNVAAFLTARIAEKEHQRNWLPAKLEKNEPYWWCYSQKGPDASIEYTPLPLPANLPPATFLWTPWIGAPWFSKEWQVFGDKAARWAGVISYEQEIKVWDDDTAMKIVGLRDEGFVKEEDIRSMIQGASQMILKRLATIARQA